MAYIADNYLTNKAAPFKHWVCTRTSSLGPFAVIPSKNITDNPDYCGQCVSIVTRVCPLIPVSTAAWKKGKLVKGDQSIAPGTAIATFDKNDKYKGHAAIYESQNKVGIAVVDQWVLGNKPTAIHQRVLRFGAAGNSDNGDNFYVVD